MVEYKEVPFEWSCSQKDGTLIPIETLWEKSAEEDLLIKPNALKESTIYVFTVKSEYLILLWYISSNRWNSNVCLYLNN